MPDYKKSFDEAYKNLPPDQALEQLRRVLNRGPEGDEIVPGWPKVATPAPFRPYPEVIGGSELNNAVKELFHIAPETQGSVRRIQNAPTSGVFNEMRRSNISPYNYLGTNLLGLTPLDQGYGKKDIYVAPQGPEGSLNTVVHEMSHVMGSGEAGAQESESLLDRYRHPEQNFQDSLDALAKLLSDKLGVPTKVER